MKKRWKWNERTRLMLTLELAVTLPAAALIIFSVLHLKSIQRDHAVEAAIQRDFQQVLAISDKHITEKAYEMVEQVRQQFPPPSSACAQALDNLMGQYPYVAHVFRYDRDHGMVFRSQPARLQEADFRAEGAELGKVASEWIKMDYDSFVKKFAQMEKKGKPPYYFFANMVPRGDKHEHQSVALFLLPTNGTDEHPAIGGMAFDAEFLRDRFFPEMLSDLMRPKLSAESDSDKSSYNNTVMMVHMKGEATPTVASADWDGGEPEAERPLDASFPGLMLAIKLRGTTIAALGQRFVRTSFLILGAISLLLTGGILLTYRNVSKEVALARLKSDFVSNVSHELRTPLSLIRLYAETLEMARVTTPEKIQEYYRIIRKESERLTALINNILDFSRIEAGRKEYAFSETDLAELVRNTLESYRYQIEQNGFALQENIADKLPSVRVDREAIARSLVNLVNNALKYSQERKYLGVSLYRDNGALKLEVVDRPRGRDFGGEHPRAR